MYFESHAHYDDRRFDKDREELLKLLPSSGIDYVINVGADMASSKNSIDLAEKYTYFYAAVGVHPHEVKLMTEKDILVLEEMTNHKKTVAIGEIGLDYYYDNSPRPLQRIWFQKQLELAEKIDLPVIIHSREASQECFQMIQQSNVRKGVIHCYSGSAQMALDYVKMGFLIGIGGVLTYKNAVKLLEVVKEIPLKSLLIETDSPYLSPAPKRGERNDSKNLIFIVNKMAEIKGISASEIANVTKQNAENLFFK